MCLKPRCQFFFRNYNIVSICFKCWSWIIVKRNSLNSTLLFKTSGQLCKRGRAPKAILTFRYVRCGIEEGLMPQTRTWIEICTALSSFVIFRQVKDSAQAPVLNYCFYAMFHSIVSNKKTLTEVKTIFYFCLFCWYSEISGTDSTNSVSEVTRNLFITDDYVQCISFIFNFIFSALHQGFFTEETLINSCVKKRLF